MNPRAALLVAVAVGVGCSTRRPEPGEPGPSAKAEPGAITPSTGALQSRDAPFLAGASRVVAFPTPAGPRIAAAGPGFLRLLTTDGKIVAEADAVGDAHVLELFDVDGDGTAELIVGRGQSHLARDAPASLTVVRAADLGAPEVIDLPPTTRPQIVGVAAASRDPGDLYVAAFESKFFAQIVRARRDRAGVWTTAPVSKVRVPGGIASLPDGRLAVARMYGDDNEEPGDLRVGSAERSALVPTTRGVRAVIEHNGGLIFADGWHQNYGQRARALITSATESGGSWSARPLADVAGRWGYDRLEVADIHGDGSLAVVATGNGPAVLVPLRGPNIGQVTTLGDTDASDAFAADLDQDGADEVIVLGPSPSIWRRGADPAR